MYRSLPALVIVVLLGGCAGRQPDAADDRPLIPALAPYRMDIRQGNVVDAAMLARLQLGMSREQVRTLMGTPQLIDPFNPNRWDYTFTERKGYQPRVQRSISLYFSGDRLQRVAGDVQPVADAREKNLLIAGTRTTVDVPPSDGDGDGVLARLLVGLGGEPDKPGRRDLARFVETEEARQYETVEGGQAEVPAPEQPASTTPAPDDAGQGLFDGLLGRGD